MTDADQMCPSCSEAGVQWHEAIQQFGYGVGEEAVTIVTVVPLGTCTACGFEFTDCRGEAKRHDAVCRHLRVLTPSEVRNVREQRGFSQAELALALGVDVASVKSWERGLSIQNVANDALLRIWERDNGNDRRRG